MKMFGVPYTTSVQGKSNFHFNTKFKLKLLMLLKKIFYIT